MQTLIIGPQDFKKAVTGTRDRFGEVLWADGLIRAFSYLDVEEIDLVIFDGRATTANTSLDLKSLIANIPVTTRILALVEQLPVEDIFALSGVVYLTPPVNLDDIHWFIRSNERNHAVVH